MKLTKEQRYCYHCGKVIRKTVQWVIPSRFHQSLGDFTRTYHPRCYVAAERRAAVELLRTVQS